MASTDSPPHGPGHRSFSRTVVVLSHHKNGGGKPLDSLWFSRPHLARLGINLEFPWTGGRVRRVLGLIFRADYVVFDGVWSTVLWRAPLFLAVALVLRKKLLFYWHETDWHIRGRWPYDKTADNSEFRGKEYLRRLPTLYALRRDRFVHMQLSNYGCQLLREVVGVPPGNVKILRNMSRSERLLSIEVPSDYERGLIVACGHVKANKRPDIFLDIAERLSRKRALKFVWIGRPDGVFDIEAEVRKRGVGHVVRFENWTPDPQRVMAKANLFLHTSQFEGMPKVMMEALALGKPVVAFDVGGVAELLGEHGQVLPFGDIEGMVRAVERGLADMSEEAQCARRRYYEEHFTENAFASRFKKILDDLE